MGVPCSAFVTRENTNPMREALLAAPQVPRSAAAPPQVADALLYPQHLHNHPFPPLPVELGIEDALPGSQVQLAIGHRKGGLVM